MPVTAAVFAAPLQGHFKRIRPLVESLAQAGVRVVVLTDGRFESDAKRLGAGFVDLYAGRPIDGVDAVSIPMSCRFVSFAGRYGDDIVGEMRALRPSLVVHDTFSVIGRVVAHHLAVPRVNVCAGHNLEPRRIIEAVHRDLAVRISESCEEAAAALRERHGIPDASPFTYVSARSPDLNIYCEPEEFLPPVARGPFEPIAFFGSVRPEDAVRSDVPVFPSAGGRVPAVRVYASFGTIVWHHFEAVALSALEALSEHLSGRDDASAVVSLGGRAVEGRAAALARPNVRVMSYVDQWQALGEATACLTHHGLSSTHEAIFGGVPMLSYPFFWDQPGLAARCGELGLAVPLTTTLRGPVDSIMIDAALARIEESRTVLRARLADARQWELDTIRRRPDVIRRIMEFVS